MPTPQESQPGNGPGKTKKSLYQQFIEMQAGGAFEAPPVVSPGDLPPGVETAGSLQLDSALFDAKPIWKTSTGASPGPVLGHSKKMKRPPVADPDNPCGIPDHKDRTVRISSNELTCFPCGRSYFGAKEGFRNPLAELTHKNEVRIKKHPLPIILNDGKKPQSWIHPPEVDYDPENGN